MHPIPWFALLSGALWSVCTETPCKYSEQMQQPISMPSKDTLEGTKGKASREVDTKALTAFKLFGLYSETDFKPDDPLHVCQVPQP